MLSSVFNLLGFGPRRKQPATVPSDEILPLGLFDDTPILRKSTLMWTFKFDDVLDADRLGDSLSTLFQMEGWRKLGGRFRLRSDGKAEIHIPTPFTEERPPIYFTKENFDISIAEHPEASRLPRATDTPTCFPRPREYLSLGLGPGSPTCFEDYIYSDIPQFSLHVVTFTDGTLVSINFSHVTSDLSGLVSIINAWQLVLAGQSELVGPFLGYREDSMKGLYDSIPKETFLLKERQMSMWDFTFFGLRTVFDAWWNVRDSRVMCVPAQAINKLINESRLQLQQENGAADLFISEVNIILAVFIKSLAKTLPAATPLTSLQAVDPRPRLPSIFQPGATYVGNAPAAVFSFLTASEVCQTSIGELALSLRKDLQVQLQEEQMNAVAVLAREHMVKTGYPAMFGDKNASLLISSSWMKANFCQNIDFSPAIIGARRHVTTTKPGRPSYFHSAGIEKALSMGTIVRIAGRDADQNLWIVADLPPSNWSTLMADLALY